MQIIFTDDDYGTIEGNEELPVRILKNSRIANPIILDVVPLTVMDASTQSPGLPNNIPDNNTFSPPFASKY